MNEITPGDLVDITIKGVRMGDRSHIRVTIEDERGELWVLPPQAAITRSAPAEWPPRKGDLWRDGHGSLWFALYDNYGRRLVMMPADPTKGLSAFQPDEVLRASGPLILVHREDVS